MAAVIAGFINSVISQKKPWTKIQDNGWGGICLSWRLSEKFILWKKTGKNWKIAKDGLLTFDKIVGI